MWEEGQKGRHGQEGQAGQERFGPLKLRLALIAVALGLFAPQGAQALPDNRSWELVSPVDKNGGGIALPSVAGAGSSRAAAQGGSVAFASAASFGEAAGAAPFSQYLARRGTGGWSTQNLTPAHLTGAYAGNPYVAFSADLARALTRNPARCTDGDPCPPGYGLRDIAGGVPTGSPADPGLFAGASPDLSHLVFLDGDDLYRWSPPATALTLVNDAPAAELPAREGAVSVDGSRIYWQGADGNLHLRQGATTLQVDDLQGGGGRFEVASADGAVAFFSKAGHLYRYSAQSDSAADLTPGGGVTSVLGASADGAAVYYLLGPALRLWRGGITSSPAGAADLSDAMPDTAGVTADGARLYVTTDHKLLLADTNGDGDVYQWEGGGTGSCAKSIGCLELISSGRSEDGDTFVDASASGGDVFFLTDRSLVASDPGSVDLYDARVGGGFSTPPTPIPCLGDACQSLPAEPLDPVLGTLISGPGNPAVRYHRYKRRNRERCRRSAKARPKCERAVGKDGRRGKRTDGADRGLRR